MILARTPLWRAVIAVIDRAPLGSDGKLRLQHYTLLLALGAPSMLGFAVAVGLRGERTLCAAILFTVSGLLLGWALIGRGVRPVLIYRTNYVIFCSLPIPILPTSSPATW